VLAMNGETKVFSDSPATLGVNYEFCPNCGSTVHWTFDNIPQVRGIAVGCFVDKSFPKPDIEIQTQYRHHWVDAIQGLRGFEAFPRRSS
jgi:hypothetical protein